MNTDIIIIICATVLIIFFAGDPDIVDAIINNLLGVES